VSVDPYDWDEFERRTSPRPPVRGRAGVPAAMLAAALWAVDDVVLGEKRREPVVEEIPMPGPDLSQPVVVHLVWGAPRLSYAVVRNLDAG
jgi:hypothetical protein